MVRKDVPKIGQERIYFMKITLFSRITLIIFVTFMLVQHTAAQEYTRFNLPEGAKIRLGKGSIRSMAYSPDGTRLAAATPIGIWIYDAHTGEDLNVLLIDTDYMGDVAFSPDGRTLASTEGRAIHLWDAVTGQLRQTLTGLYYPHSPAFSPDGRTLVAGNLETIHLWDAVTGQLRQTLTGPNNLGGYVAFSPDGRTLASGDGRAIHLWDAATGQLRQTLTGPNNISGRVAFSPDSRTLASTEGRAIHLWDAATGQLRHTLTGHTDKVWSVAFSPDSRTLASGGRYDKTIRLWDTATGQLRQILTRDVYLSLPINVAFNPDGRTLASGDGGGIHFWDAATGQLRQTLTGHTDRVRSVAFSPDGRTLASGDGGGIHFWDAATGQLRQTLTGHTDIVHSVAFSPDGRTLASGSYDKTIRLWDTATGQPRQTLTGPNNTGNTSGRVAFNPDGRTLASTNGVDIYFWDAATGQLRQTLTDTSGVYYGIGYVYGVAFSPDGRTLASGSYDETIRLWDTATGQLRQTLNLTGHSGKVNNIMFSPDGRTLASGSDDETIRLWDTATGQLRQTFAGHSIAFSPDGQMLAISDVYGSALLDAITGAVKTRFPGGSHAFAFSPDGRTLASGSNEGFVFLWEFTPDILQQSGHIPDSLRQPKLNLPPMIRLIYFYPSDRAPAPNMDTSLDTLIKETQHLYAEQMENHGFGRKTFIFEKDAKGNAIVHKIKGRLTAADYSIGTVQTELSLYHVSKHIRLVILDESLIGARSGGLCGIAVRGGISFGDDLAFDMDKDNLLAIVSCATVGVTAHELGHTFGLAHDYRDNRYIMNHVGKNHLSYTAAEWLNVHPFLNPDQPRSNSSTTMKILSRRVSRLQFQVKDTDGLHQAQLILTERTIPNNPCGTPSALHNSKALNGTPSSTLQFVATEASIGARLQTIDLHGNVAWKNFWIEQDSTASDIEDVNGDGAVNVLDLALVANSMGQTGPNAADVNDDGVVNIADLVLVAGALGNAAAPSAHLQTLEMFTAADVKLWLTQAQQLDLKGATAQRGILFLGQLLAAMIPKETALLPNYPNPFNPETWIPYQIAKAAAVTLTIYDASGQVVRQFALGHQPAGMYQNRSRAVYWDGKNGFGEPVASGAYFYTLTASDYSATRQMLILK